MRKRISILIVDHSRSAYRRVTTSRLQLSLLVALAVASATAVTLAAYDYLHLRKTVPYTRSLEAKIADQDIRIRTRLAEMQKQREQLDLIVSEVQRLRAKLLALNELESKIRSVAGGGASEHVNEKGVGGPLPEDIDPQGAMAEPKGDTLQAIHYQLRLLEETSSVQQKQLQAVVEYLARHRKLFDRTPSLRPCRGRVTAGYGYRRSPFNNRREIHKGMDIAGRRGTPIVATADGVVSFVGRRRDFGRVIEIDHGRGLMTRYAHCQKIIKKLGSRVKRGETIALMGNSGRSTGPHLHYEVRLNGIPLDPSKFILE